MPDRPVTFFATERPDPKRITRRRISFFSAVFFITALACWLMADMIWEKGVSGLEMVIFVLFTMLTGVIAMGFCQAVAGFYVLRRGGDSCRITRSVDWENPPALASTAVAIPIFNEDVSRVFEGLRVIYKSVEETGQLAHFDFFILSDSNDPNKWIEEEVAWVELCKQTGGFGRIFYRKRRQPINRKSGNIEDFCKRWGSKYRYMAVLDADSIMTGASLVGLVRMMERNPGVGIIQTTPQLVNGETLFARMQQFASRLYGPVFSAGLNYWQQAEGNYWGHNAIIRLAAFIDHCALPDLPGKEPFGGRILSHDYVEAALMRKAGYSVWMAYDLGGSFEEGPPTLIDAVKRDRRWCQGNLQHSWLLFTRGFQIVSRIHLFLGIMSYLSSPLWLLFLLFSYLQMFRGAGGLWVGASSHASLGFLSNLVHVSESLLVFSLVCGLLFLPKLLCVWIMLEQPDEVKKFGGKGRVVASAVLETLVSMLLAPVQMLFISKFVFFTLIGTGVSWVTQNRGSGDGTDWREAILTHGGQTVLGLLTGYLIFIDFPSLVWWFSPIMGGLALSIPVSVCLSKMSFGQTFRRWGLFLTPEETEPPPELDRLRRNLDECYRHMRPIPELRPDYGLLQAVLDPYINAVHVSLLRQRKRTSTKTVEHYIHLREKLLRDGPEKLSTQEKLNLLFDADSMIWLHGQLWLLPSQKLALWWQLAMRQYNVLTTTPVTALYR